jgi:hypothetical protein
VGKGGARPGAGRKPGSINTRRSTEALQAVADAYPGWSPLAFLAQVANDDAQPMEVRLDAAKAAARFMVPVPKPIETDPDTVIAIEERLSRFRNEGNAKSSGLEGLVERLNRAHQRHAALVATEQNGST